MSASILSAPYFHNEESAYEFVQSRLWPNNKAVCPFCGGQDRTGKLSGKSTRIGVHKCYDCRKPFTVKVGTIFESSHIPLRLWLQAIFLIASSKKGISSNQLHRTLGVTLKSAWFMSHRVREAMKDGGLAVFGTGGGIVEVDETFIGHDKTIKPKGVKKGRGFHHKNKILALVDRNTKKARSMVVDDVKASTLAPLVRANVAPEAHLMTDDAKYYEKVGKEFVSHGYTRHMKGEYVSRENPMIHTNTIEGYFSVFKRGMRGTYQHCAHHHLHRYLAEFDFRYNNRIRLGIDDKQRAENLLQGVVGKRLTYQTTASGVSAAE
jgi:transposase-like protein